MEIRSLHQGISGGEIAIKSLHFLVIGGDGFCVETFYFQLAHFSFLFF